MRAVVFANGVLGDARVARHLAGAVDLVLCADGGTHHASLLGIRPHVVIGDMDSLSSKLREDLRAAGTEFLTYATRKDETDLELALLYAAERRVKEVAVLGAWGGRIDHELGNLFLLAHPRLLSMDIRFVCGTQEIVAVRQVRVFDGAPGDLLSLLPIAGDALGITTVGLEYPLNDETLYFGLARGVSNVFTVAQPRVQVRSGLLIAVHTRQRED